MKKTILILFILPFSLMAQEYRKCPLFNAEEHWERAESFAESRKNIEELIEWLISTPPTEQLIERSAASIFVMEWVTKNPNLLVNVEVGPYNDYLITEDLMLAYLFGNINYALKHEGRVKQEAQRIAGLKVLLFLIEHSESYSKNKVFKSLLRASRKGELNEFDKEMWMNYKSQALLYLEKLN
jgi:hypothetical protein